jgi:DUF1365 family protein
MACLEDKRKFTRAPSLAKRLIADHGSVNNTAGQHQSDAEPSQNVRHHTIGDQSDMQHYWSNFTDRAIRWRRSHSARRRVREVITRGAHREPSLHCLAPTNVARHTASRRTLMPPHTKPLLPCSTTCEMRYSATIIIAFLVKKEWFRGAAQVHLRRLETLDRPLRVEQCAVRSPAAEHICQLHLPT